MIIISQSRLFITMIFAPLALAMTPLLPLSIHQSGSRPTLSSFRGDNIHSHHRRALKSRNRCEEIITSLRGGSDGAGSGNDSNDSIGSGVPESAAASPYQQPTQLPPSPTPQAAATTTANNGGEFVDVLGANNDPMYGYRETVEDRIDAWRRQQQHKQQTQSAAEAASAVDEQGRFKLFTTVSKVSVSFFFFILMWRTVHHYELADATFGPTGRMKSGGFKAFLVRTIVLSPLVVLFLGEMMGAILGISGGGGGQSHATKKRLKGVLNLHKGVELIMMAYNIVRLALFPSKYTIREVYIGRTISNFFFLIQCQLYTKLSWDDVSQSTSGEYVYESYYDDYTPEMESEYSSYGYAETTPPQNEYYQQNENDGYAAEGQQNQQYYPQQ